MILLLYFKQAPLKQNLQQFLNLDSTNAIENNLVYQIVLFFQIEIIKVMAQLFVFQKTILFFAQKNCIVGSKANPEKSKAVFQNEETKTIGKMVL